MNLNMRRLHNDIHCLEHFTDIFIILLQRFTVFIGYVNISSNGLTRLTHSGVSSKTFGRASSSGKLSRIAGVSLDAAEVLELFSKLDVLLVVEDEELVETVEGGAEEEGEKTRGDA
jgi:hypothetical protein